MGLGTYFGNLVSQNGKGHLLGHVKDLGEDSSKIDEVRIYRTNARYVFFSFFLSFLPLSQRKREKKGNFGFKYLLFEEGSFSFVIEKHLLHFVDSPFFSSPDTIQKWLVTQFPF